MKKIDKFFKPLDLPEQTQKLISRADQIQEILLWGSINNPEIVENLLKKNSTISKEINFPKESEILDNIYVNPENFISFLNHMEKNYPYGVAGKNLKYSSNTGNYVHHGNGVWLKKDK